MKFVAPKNPKEIWDKNTVKEKLDAVEFDIKELNRELNKTQSTLNEIFQKRFSIQKRIGDKCRYKSQLIVQLNGLDMSEWNEL